MNREVTQEKLNAARDYRNKVIKERKYKLSNGDEIGTQDVIQLPNGRIALVWGTPNPYIWNLQLDTGEVIDNKRYGSDFDLSKKIGDGWVLEYHKLFDELANKKG